MPDTPDTPTIAPARRSRLTAALMVLAVALVAVGAWLWWTEPVTEFGWFAYEPISQDALSALVAVTGRRYAAIAALGAGLLLCAGLVGFALGQRRARS